MNHFQSCHGVADVIAPVNMQQIQGKNGGSHQVARTRLGFVEERNNQQSNTSFNVEGWNEVAHRLAAIPVGNTVMWTGKFENRSYQDQQGNKKWTTSIRLMSIADCGPSKYPPNQGQQAQGQAGYQNQQGGQRTNTQSRGFQGPPQGQQTPPAGQWGGQAPVGFDADEPIPF